MSKPFSRRCRSYLRCTALDLLCICAKPLFWICAIPALLPGLLLSGLLLWKSVFFPASVPLVLPGLFLLLWVILSWALPAVCAAALLTFPPMRCHLMLMPVTAALLLLAGLWCLLLLYHLPFCLCGFCAALSAVAALLAVRPAMRIAPSIGALLLLCGAWNTLLALVSFRF